jgi:hypothetical protein
LSYFQNRDFLIEVSKGLVPGHALVEKFGRNDAVGSGAFEFVNLLGFATLAWPISAATTVRIKAGGAAADTAAGANAQEVTVEGLDGTGAEVSEAIATNGALASTVTTATFLRPQRAWVSAVGTYGVSNAAAITIESGTGGTDLLQIAIGEGQTQFGAYSIPAGKTGYLLGGLFTVDSNARADVRMFQRQNLDDTSAPMSAARIVNSYVGVIGEQAFGGAGPRGVFPEKTDVWAEAKGSAGASSVAVDFEILLVDN